MSSISENKYFFENCSKLDYTIEKGLITDKIENPSQQILVDFAKEKLDADAVFFYTSATNHISPLIYFKKLDYQDPKKIAELHKIFWNMGQGPFLFIVLPEKIIIYSSYIPPHLTEGKLDPDAGFLTEINILSEFESKIQEYNRIELLSGRYWEKNERKFDKNKRVFEMLLKNLRYMRDKLKEDGLPLKYVHSLLIRSIFIKYLEDRKDKDNNNVFPEQFFSKFLINAHSFNDLLNDKSATYSFFSYLENKFGGDTLKIDKDEINNVDIKHLKLLKKLLKGEEHMQEKQMVLWPLYSFDVIPIELLSEIYQNFFHNENTDKNKDGTYFTPKHLVNFLNDEILPWNGEETTLQILDPACGSGIFLVDCYRRLIYRWSKKNKRNPDINELTTLLKNNIFGVDKNGQAIQIAALSLYLTICDYLKPRYIWEQVKFEPLIGSNLFPLDYFDPSLFHDLKFDIIIGNPPWQSELSEPAKRYVKRHKLIIGDNQICQAFLWKIARDSCKTTSKVCLLVASKSLLFNKSKQNLEFRKSFFKTYTIKKIFNFSLLRKTLFSESVAPATAIIFNTNKYTEDDKIFYCTIKPTYTTQDNFSFHIDMQDINNISYNNALSDENIWKIMMWGSPRDYELVKKLGSLETIKQLIKKYRWINGIGYKLGTGKKHIDYNLKNYKYLDVSDMNRYIINEDNLKYNELIQFHRSAKNKRLIFKGPLLLIKGSPDTGIGLISAVVKNDILYKCTILGIHAPSEDINKLVSCCLIINSNIALYYMFITSRKWLVERDAFQIGDLLNIPIPDNFEELDLKYDDLINIVSNIKLRDEYNQKIFASYKLTENDTILINDAINCNLDVFWKKRKSLALKPVSDKQIISDYADRLCTTLNNSFISSKYKFYNKIYYDINSAYLLIKIILLDSEIDTTNSDNKILEELNKIDKMLINSSHSSLYVRKIVKSYIDNTIYIAKPNQLRFWTKSSALNDADGIYFDIMSLKEE
ncbi:MAG: N-6 DNA methylase [Candidatus Bathyarchaeota archaeon]|nr:N-6 DNA methylase [Candidatus Bathyarchaeota archaeon]